MNKLNLTGGQVMELWSKGEIRETKCTDICEDWIALHNEVERLERMLITQKNSWEKECDINESEIDRLTQSLMDAYAEMNWKPADPSIQSDGFVRYVCGLKNGATILRKHFPKELGGKE